MQLFLLIILHLPVANRPEESFGVLEDVDFVFSC